MKGDQQEKTTTTTTTVYHTNIQPIMSHEGQEELLDYSDSEEIAVSTTTQASGEAQSNDKESDKKDLMLVSMPPVSETFIETRIVESNWGLWF